MFKMLRKKKQITENSEPFSEIPRYPPFARGLPSVTVPQLLESQDALIKRIRLSVGSSPDYFDKYFLPIIERYANYVHLLPASEAHHHQLAGGLFRHGLEVSWEACRLYKGHTLTGRMTADKRKLLEPRWQLAVFILAICHDLGKPAFDLEVTNREGDKTWDPHSIHLGTWLLENNISHYHIHWSELRMHHDHEYFASSLLHLIISPMTMQYLSSGSRIITRSIHESLSKNKDTSEYVRVISAMVSKADSISVSEDLKSNHISTTGASIGVPVARHIIDAMRRLVRNHEWKVNRPGSRVWANKEGVFIIWHAACEEIKLILRKDNVSGIPGDPDAIADLLIDRDIAVPSVDENSSLNRYWKITPVLDKHSARVKLTALKLHSYELISDDPLPSFATILTSDDEAEENNELEIDNTDQVGNNATAHKTTALEDKYPAPDDEPAGNVKVVNAATLIAHMDKGNIQDKPAAQDSKTVKEPLPETTNNKATEIEQLSQWDTLIQMFTLAQKKTDFNDNFYFNNKRYCVNYPVGIKELPKLPKEYLNEFFDINWLCAHPETPMKKTMNVSIGVTNNNAMVFNESITKKISAYLGIKINDNDNHVQKVTTKQAPVTSTKKDNTQNKTKTKVNNQNRNPVKQVTKNLTLKNNKKSLNNPTEEYGELLKWLRNEGKRNGSIVIANNGIWTTDEMIKSYCKQSKVSFIKLHSILQKLQTPPVNAINEENINLNYFIGYQ